MLSLLVSLLLLSLTSAQHKLFLVYSDNQSIMSIMVNEAADYKLVAEGLPKKLVTAFNPSYMVYSFVKKMLFVCDKVQLLKYHVRVMDDGLKASAPEVLINNFKQCGGLSLDKFENLFYVADD
jgi:hypothetical protein